METSEMLDVAARIYQVLGRTFLRLTALPTLLCLAGWTFLVRYTFPALTATQAPDQVGAQLVEVGVTLGLALFVGGPLFLLGVSYSSVVVMRLVSDYVSGSVPDPRSALRSVPKSLTNLMRLNVKQLLLSTSGILVAMGFLAAGALLDAATAEDHLLSAVAVLLGGLALVLGCAVFLLVRQRYALASPAVVLEGVSAGAAARRSRELMSGAMRHPSGHGAVWTFYFVCGFLALLVYGGVQGIVSLIGLSEHLQTLLERLPMRFLFEEVLNLAPAFLVLWVVVPFWASAIAVLYFERRIRLEGYDIQNLASEVWRADRSTRFEL
jgi:hypothetical protein